MSLTSKENTCNLVDTKSSVELLRFCYCFGGGGGGDINTDEHKMNTNRHSRHSSRSALIK